MRQQNQSGACRSFDRALVGSIVCFKVGLETMQKQTFNDNTFDFSKAIVFEIIYIIKNSKFLECFESGV